MTVAQWVRRWSSGHCRVVKAEGSSPGVEIYIPISFSSNDFISVTVAQWVRRWSSGHRVVKAEGSSPGVEIYIYTNFFFSNDFILVLLGLMDFSDIVQ